GGRLPADGVPLRAGLGRRLLHCRRRPAATTSPVARLLRLHADERRASRGTGGEEVEIGIKDSADPDDGTEVKKKVTVTPDWQTYTFPLADFSTANLHAVYVVAEFVFEGGTGSTVDVQSVSYESSGSSGGEIDGSLAGQATIIAGRKKTQPLQLAVVARNGTWSASDVASRLSVFGTFVRKGNLLNLTIDATSTLLLSDYLGATTGG